jgi:alkaline phosphatase
LDYECDRDISKQPSLSEMTKKAINLLQSAVDADPKSTGFYLLVEGSRFLFPQLINRIDHAHHINDPVAASKDALQFDETFRVAADFAKNHGNTAVVSGLI